MSRVTRLAFPTLAALLLASPMALAACPYPKAPASLPDGNTATKEEMMAGKASVTQFNKDVEAYNACLDTELQAALADASLTDEQRKNLTAMSNAKHDAAVDELTALAGKFNDQVKAYKAKSAAATPAK
ncbi:MAG: hypothetical protein ACKO0U_06510 [Gammaproteobacteria bacterium]